MNNALASYVSFMDSDGVDVGVNFQNFFNNETRNYEGRAYSASGFGYSGAIFDLQAANTEGVLVFPVTEMSQSWIRQAADERWLVRIKTVWLDPETLNETGDRIEEVYAVVAWRNNLTELQVSLSSVLNAQDAELPSRVLSQRIVGSLPPKGSIDFV